MKVYLAGKIGKNDWRTAIVGAHAGLASVSAETPWPELARAVLGRHDYVGPYFVSCSHGCAHGRDSHGVVAPQPGCFDSAPRALVVERCLEAVQRADLVFAWVDSVTAYGTIFELGYARALGKPVVVAHPRGFYDASDLWFARAASTTLIVDAESAEFALAQALGDAAPEAIRGQLATELRMAWFEQALAACESPIERTMLEALAPQFPFVRESAGALVAYGPAGELLQQTSLDADGRRIRLDFAVVGSARQVAVECDGFDFHDRTPDQATRDKARDRGMRRAGWDVLRFTGQEIHRDAAKCVAEVLATATAREAG